MSLPCLNLWCEFLARQIEALNHEESVIFEAKAEVKARDLHLEAPHSYFALLNIIPLVVSNVGRLHYDIFKTDVTMDYTFPVKPLESFCQAFDTLCNVVYLKGGLITFWVAQVFDVVSEGRFRLLCQKVLVALLISEAIGQ